MSEKILSAEVHFFAFPYKLSKKRRDDIAEFLVSALEEYNKQSKRGWATGFVRVKTSELSFGEAAVCDECGVHYHLNDTDFKEVKDQLLCSVCQASGGTKTLEENAK